MTDNDNIQASTITRPGHRVQRWYCSGCQCEHEASVIGGVYVHEFRQVEGQSSLECACGATPNYQLSPLESPPLQSLKEVESTRAEEEDYEQG